MLVRCAGIPFIVTFAFAVASCAVIIGLLATATDPDARENDLDYLAQLQKKDALVIYYDQWDENTDSYADTPRQPLPEAERVVRTVSFVNRFSAHEFVDADLVRIHCLKELKSLCVAGSKVTDKGVFAIGRLTKLESLDLSGTATTDAGCKSLADMSSLKRLVLADTSVSDEGVTNLRCLRKLEHLDLSGTDVTEKCLETPVMLPNLKCVFLGPNVVRGDVDLFDRLPQLEFYSLGKLCVGRNR